MTSIQAINKAIRGSNDIGHIDDTARDALARIMFNAVKSHKDELLTPAILLDIQRKVGDGIVTQAEKFTGRENFDAPRETLEQTAKEMWRRQPLRDLGDPFMYPAKDATIRLYKKGQLTCGKAVETDPYIFMPNS